MRALLVDDDELCLVLLQNALVDMGYEVILAPNGEQALELLRSHQIHLVITDCDMPVMDGMQLSRAIRGEDSGGYVYIIMLTSHGTMEKRIAGLEAGADDFLPKPFDPDELMVRLKTAERILTLETREVVLFAMAKLAESRDSDTGAHVERVQQFSHQLAQYLGTTPKYKHEVNHSFQRFIFQTSPLHDIGKVAIPDAILLKPGKLTPEEFAVMRTHTLIGARTIDAALSRYPNAKFLQMARDIAISHHEKYDGTGYPHGLVGEHIPLPGRIVALTDVYDALTSARVYKRAMSHEEAKAIIVKERGKHFDPDIVDAFLQCETQFKGIRDMYREAVTDQPQLPTNAPENPPPVPAAQVPAQDGSHLILVVEDDPVSRQLVVDVLNASGYATVVATCASEALALYASHRPRIILSDWIMPGMDGTTLCRRLRSDYPDDQFFFGVLTIHSDKSHLVEAFDAGVDDFIAKPFDQGELLARIRAGIRAVRLREDLTRKNVEVQLLNNRLLNLNRTLECLAVTDDLTGLSNRRSGMQRLDQQWTLVERYGGPLSVGLIDLDNFKSINDTLGHDVGDRVLRRLGAILSSVLRTTDSVCRLGGDEFLLVFPAQDLDDAMRGAERCRAAIEVAAFDLPQRFKVTVSVGVATRRLVHSMPSDLLKEADQAVYLSKRQGRNKVHAFCPEAAEPAIAAGTQELGQMNF
jgi:putative two-component system response regulator